MLGEGQATHISGSFFMSAMAAKGIPKLEAGPQKSVEVHVSYRFSEMRILNMRALCRDRRRQSCNLCSAQRGVCDGVSTGCRDQGGACELVPEVERTC